MGSSKEKRLGNLRIKILLALLAILGTLWTVSYVQLRALENELTQIAEEKIQEFVGSEEGDTFEIAVPIITVTKQYFLFGKTTGKVALYMRPVEDGHEAEAGHESEPRPEEVEDAPSSTGGYGSRIGRGRGEGPRQGGHRHAGGISGIEFFLAKEGGAWLDLESGTCGSEQCQTEGREAFEKGTHVPVASAGE